MQRRDESRALHLAAHRFHNARMAVAEDGNEDSTDRVEITLSVGVPIIEATGSLDDQRIFQEFRCGLVVDERAAQELLLPCRQLHEFSLRPIFRKQGLSDDRADRLSEIDI
jgi:hypothetical protein